MVANSRDELIGSSCKPLPSGSSKLSAEEVAQLLDLVSEWQLADGEKAIARTFVCPSYMDGVKWFAIAAAIAEQENHHPDALVTWRRVKLTFWTHTVGGLSENDFIIAAKLESAWEEFQKNIVKK